MTPDAIGPLLAMANATTVPDAVSHAIDAIEAGATAAEAQQAIDEWVAMQGAQVQQVFAGPQPMFRCRCCAWDANGGWLDEYNHRCPARPTQEDGLCDHCRQTVSCSDLTCVDMDGSRGWGCCLQSYAARTFVDLTTPCRAVDVEVPF